MKNAALLVLALALSNGIGAAEIVASGNPIPDQFIVVLEQQQFSPPGLATANKRRQDIRDTADMIALDYRGKRQHVFSESLTGFSLNISRSRALELASDPRVAYVAEDGRVESTAGNFQFEPPSWGLDRLDQRPTPLDNSYSWHASESDTPVHVYVLDSGIRSSHDDFGGRVDTVNSFNAFNDGQGVDDCNGHGTHVAGIVGGTDHGVAKNVVLHPVRVLTCQGSGSVSAVIAGIDWLTGQVTQSGHPAVANLSLASGPSAVLDNAVRTSIATGVVYVVAAGNNADSACNYSPARVSEALTVGATNISDRRLASSNYGACVDIYAPGDAIVSTFNRSDSDTLTMSGTSMAAPHVAGTAALLLARAPFGTPAQIAEEIIAQANFFTEPNSETDTGLLVYSLIEIAADSPLASGGLEFAYSCNPRNKRCTFEASLPADQALVTRYYWDFGDGQTADHKRPIIRHGYRGTSGVVNVIVAVELSDGRSYLASQAIELPR
ncbi:MAG: S8 family peptidase [Wenzhouxiangellaceae bacterium]|nr:S8 family peptidase [Wenzhouxiangellaceae bacterium]